MTSIQSTQSSMLKFMKQWARNCTPATVFHPDVLDLPFLPYFKESAKLSFILAIERSVDPLITQIRQSLLTPNYQDVSEVVFDALLLLRLLYLPSSQPLLRILPVKIYVPVMSTTGSMSLKY